jgi:hypothetical protein
MSDQAAVRSFGDYIGKGSPAINPYLPFCHSLFSEGSILNC